MDTIDHRSRDRMPLSAPSASLNGSYSAASLSGGPSSAPDISVYTLMVAGCCSGKTSFLRLLLDTSDVSHAATKDQLTSVAKFVQGCNAHTAHIRTTAVDIDLDDDGKGYPQRCTLSLIDTPSINFDDDSAAERVVSDTLRLIDSRFMEGLEDDRSVQTGDHHVHLCVYFLDPDRIVPPAIPGPPAPLASRTRANSFSQPDIESVILEPPVTMNLLCRPNLPPEEVDTIRRLSARVNVLPVIARADTLTNDRLAAVKMAVRRDLAEAGIGFGIFDIDNQYQHHKDAESLNGDVSGPYPRNISLSTRNSPSTSPTSPPLLRLPYALISPDVYSHSDGVSRLALSRHDLINQYTPSPNRPTHTKIARGRFTRNYRWGSMDILDPNHSDFLPLRTAIFHHMETLQKYTKEYLFDKFRADFHHQHATSPSLSHHGVHSMPTRSQHSSHTQTTRPILAIDTAPHSVSRHPAMSVPRDIAVGSDMRSTSYSSRPGPEPSSHSTKTSSAGPRSSRQRLKKITVACNFCRSRKLKCDGGRPACSQCVKRSNPCDYQPQNKRRGAIRQRKTGEDSDSESGEDPSEEPSVSPEVQSLPLSRRSSGADKVKSENYGASLSAPLEHRDDSLQLPRLSIRSHPVKSAPSPEEPRSYFPDNELPAIATLPLPEASPSSTINAHPLSPIRPASDQPPPPPQRRRASTISGKSRQSSNSGPKVVACNFCRARKTKCDGVHPSCSSCQRRSLQCNYVHESIMANGQKRANRRASTSKISSRSSPSATRPPSNPGASPPASAQNDERRHGNDAVENGVVDLKRNREASELSQHQAKKPRMDHSPGHDIP